MPIRGLNIALADVEKRVYEVAHQRATARVAQVLGFAISRWPVGDQPSWRTRPHSRDLFYAEDKSDGRSRVHITIQNRARDKRGQPYAFYIRSAQVPGAGASRTGMLNAWLILVRRPTLAAVKKLAEATARDPLGRG
jgi:hypothetical protein